MFLPAFLAYQIGCAEGGEHHDARAKGSILVGSFAVFWQSGIIALTAKTGRLITALEHAAAVRVGKRDQTCPEDDCDC